jgi:hypothetical protein
LADIGWKCQRTGGRGKHKTHVAHENSGDFGSRVKRLKEYPQSPVGGKPHDMFLSSNMMAVSKASIRSQTWDAVAIM